MKFYMWSWQHMLYIVSPFILVAIVYLLLRNKSDKLKYIAALIFAIINMAVLITRNVDIAIRVGKLDAELIPLGPCHFANIIFLVAVLSKKQEWYNLAWCLNLPFGFLAIIFANSLSNYQTMLAIRPQAYIWGHMFLVASILYVFLVGLTKFDFKVFKKAMVIAGIWLAVCVITNLAFNIITKGNNGYANYMYMVTPEKGTPLEILYNVHKGFSVANTSISPVYIILLSLFGFVMFLCFHLMHNGLRKLFIKNPIIK